MPRSVDEEIDFAIGQLESEARIRAVTSLDADPDKGVRALNLSRATGAPAEFIHSDLEGFEAEHKAQLTSQILDDDPDVAEYIRRHPLNSVVSNDDYGALSTVARRARQFNQLWSVSPFGVFAEGTIGAAKRAALTPISPEEFESTENKPLARLGLETLNVPRRGFEVLMSPIEGLQESVRQGGRIAEVFGMEGAETGAERLARDISGLVESEMIRGHGPNLEGIANRVRFQKFMEDYRTRAEGAITFNDMRAANTEALNRARPWIEAGREPPNGLHPEIDQVKADLTLGALEDIYAALADAETSLTRARDPETFKTLPEQIYGKISIGLSGDRIAELYRDREPLPDDGLLGWVPDMASKLEAARKFGEDVHVRLSDWITYIDPALAKDLHDDIRVWPNGITLNEAKLSEEPLPTVDSALAQVRNASGTEPMFAFGDKKLQLEQLASIEGFDEFHEFQFLNGEGKPVGEITILPDPKKKELYVANISGLAGLYSNSFGPSLIRDLKKQLKAIYPDYEWITGHRVSGAREKAGTFEDKDVAFPKVRLSLEDWTEADTRLEYMDFREFLEDRARQEFDWGISATLEPTELLGPFEAEVSQIIHEEIARITNRGAETHVVSEIEYADFPGKTVHGVSFTGQDNVARILVDLFSQDPIGIARHETIHYLKRAGLFEPKEWNALVKAARDENWLDRYHITERYGHLDLRKQYEEAIADGFRDWANTKDEIPQPDTMVTRAFQKILDLWNTIKVRFKELTGRDLNPDELFTKVMSGEVGNRREEIGASEPMFSIDPESAKLKFDALRAETAGLDQKSFTRLQKSIQARFEEDLAAAKLRAERIQRKTQSAEWKEETSKIRGDVWEAMSRRPDIMADLLIGAGEFDGKFLGKRFPLKADELTAEQKSALPRHYYSKDGISVDTIARMFGYDSGDTLIAKLIDYNRDRGNSTAREHLNKVIEAETERVMQAKYGELDQNILRDAEDQAFSETNLNLLAEEWQGAAMQAGVAVVDKDLVKAEVTRVFNNMRSGDVDFNRIMAQIQKHYNQASRDLISGKPADALLRLQRRYELALLAAEAKKFEKARGVFDRTAKRMSKREVDSIEHEFTNFVHGILNQIGKPVRRSTADIAKEIKASGYRDLQHFVESKAADQYVLQVWDQLFDPTWKKEYDNLTTEEFYAVKDSIDSLIHVGREERKVYKAGEKVDRDTLISELVDSLERFGEVPLDKGTSGLRPSIFGTQVRKGLDTFVASHINMITYFDRWDQWNLKGSWNQGIFRMFSEAAGTFGADQIKYAKVFKDEIEKVDSKWLNKSVDNPIFRNPRNGALMQFTNKNLLTIMLYTGTKSSRFKMAAGYGLEVGDMMSWIDSVATKKHWDFVQSIWDNVFRDIKDKHDTMMRSLSGVPVKEVELSPIETPFGTYRGGYMRIKYHPEFKQTSQKLIGRDPLESEDFFGVIGDPGFTKDRTGYVGPMILDLDSLPSMVNDILHDLAFRPAVLNAAKVLRDPKIQEAVAKHVGGEVRDELIPWLRGIVNATASPGRNMTILNQWSESIRQNVVFGLVGFNIGTVLKHTPTALGTSLKEVGPAVFGRGFKALFMTDPKTGERNYDLMMRMSNEMRLRNRNWEQSVYGSTRALFPGSKGVDTLIPLRQKILEFSTKPVAFGDFISAGPTWLGKYMEEMDKHGITGDAVYAADRAVQRAHGSVSEIYRSAIQRDMPKWFTSIFNFWSDILNRQFETYWKAGEAIGAVKEKNRVDAMKYSKEVAAGLFTYWVWAAFIEHAVSGGGDKDESWGAAVAKSLLHTSTGGWFGVRDATSMIERSQGGDPQIGLAGTAFGHVLKIFTDFTKDDPLNKKHLGRVLQDGASFLGATTGLVSDQMGRAVRFVHDVNAGIEHPKGLWDWMIGLRFGTIKKHSR